MHVVTTTAGPVAGRAVSAPAEAGSSRDLWYFGGVPYARAERFGAPMPPLPWHDVRDARTPGAAPPQRADGPAVVPGMTPDRIDEDCLTAEIWSPGPGGRRPVLVWVPGGSFRIGGASLPTYDGRRLAAEGDVVVIGLNYRLGALGFLAADGVPSNLGLRDLLAALDWIRANAASFGGDGDRITLMGESAGAGAILHLLTRPDLPCRGAIVLSGSPTMTLTERKARAVAERFLALAGVPSAAALAGADVEAVLDAQAKAVVDLAATAGMMPFHPWVDGDVVPRAPLDAAADDALAPVALVLCTTAHEMELFRTAVPTLPDEFAVPFLAAKGRALGLDHESAERGLAACEGDLVTAIADVDLHLPALAVARSHARRGLDVWRASFTWEAPTHRACHALDLPFHFGSLDVEDWRAFAGAADPAAARVADQLSARLRAAWTTFATRGRPVCEPIGHWPAFDDERVIELGAEVGVVPDPARPRWEAWT